MFWSDLGSAVGFEAIGLVDSSLQTFAVFAKQTPAELVQKHLALNEAGKKDGGTQSEATANPTIQAQTPDCEPIDKYNKGIIFYKQGEKIVGILLWNVFNRISIARKILASDDTFKDLNEVAKLFDIFDQHHEDKEK